ncbi:MAG: choice-of-anchor Q domain-containing protein [Planctomycetota bacterium]
MEPERCEARGYQCFRALMEPLEPRLLLSGDPRAVPRIIDDADAGFTTTGDWVTDAIGHAGDSRASAAPDAVATWTFTDVCPGYRYRVYATWPEGADRTAAAQFTLVDHLDASKDRILADLLVDQRVAPDDRVRSGTAWDSLGEPLLVRGAALSIRLSGDGLHVADAVRIERVGLWQPPIGVPAPTFGIGESHWAYASPLYTFDYGRGRELYRLGADGPYTHVVDNTHPDATDTDNPLGTPDQPRLTIPLDLPPGSVVEVRGGPYTYANYHGSRLGITGRGTPQRPIFVRGTGLDAKAVFANEVRVRGSYLILEHFRTDTVGANEGLLRVLNPSDHVAIRRGEATNLAPASAGFRAIWAVMPVADALGGDAERFLCNDIVFYNNDLHDNTPQPADESGLHAITPQGNCHNIWIVDNRMARNGEDGVQIYYNRAYANHVAASIYVGRNLMHHNGENAVDIKQSRDVVVSENIMYGYAPVSFPNGSGSDGTALVIHYDPENVWILANEIYDSANGIRSNGSVTAYILGNVIRDIHHVGTDYNPISAWSGGAGILGWANGKLHIVGNTIHDVDAGIHSPGGGDQAWFIHNNIIADLAEPSHHIAVTIVEVAQRSLVTHNLLHQDGAHARIAWGGTTVLHGVDAFQAAWGEYATANVEADPCFADPAAGDLRLHWLVHASPAVDAGGGLRTYVDLFRALHGLDIGVDLRSVARPQGEAVDIGAFEAPAAVYTLDDFAVLKSHFGTAGGAIDADGDLDGDGDVDLDDFAILKHGFARA